MRRGTKLIIGAITLIAVLAVVGFLLFAESAPQMEVPQFGEPGPPPAAWPR